MKCPICGSENPADARVCESCEAEFPAGKPKSRKLPLYRKLSKITNKLILPATAAGLLLLILFAIVYVTTDDRNGHYIFVEQNVACFTDKSGSTTAVFVDGKAIGDTIEGSVTLYWSGLDNTVTLFSANDGDKTFLWTLYGDELTKIAGSDKWTDFVMAASGEGIAYTVEDGRETALCLYDVSKNKSTKVQTAAQIESVVLSPDGESLTYVMPENGEKTGYFFDGGKNVRLGRDVRAIALSDGGKYIYALSDENGAAADGGSADTGTINLHNNRGEKKSVIGPYSVGSDRYFNADHTQMLYTCEGKTYISVKGGEGVPFFKESGIRPILPEDTAYAVSTNSTIDWTVPVDSFYDLYYYSRNAIYQITKDYENPVRLASKVHDFNGLDGITLSEDASTIYYLKQNSGLSAVHDLMMVRTAWGSDGPDKAVTIAETIIAYAVTSDCQRVYYWDGDLLYSADGSTGRSVRGIAENIKSGIVIGKGDILYFRKGRNLYACSNGKDAELVLSDAEFMTVRLLEIIPGIGRGADEYLGRGFLGCYFIETDEAIYCTVGAKTPKKIFNLD